MKVHRLHARQLLPLSREEAWSFFSDPMNLQEITPPSMRFRVTSEVPPEIHAGLIITYRVTPLLGVPVTWVTEITHLVPGRLFVDEQRFGPYRFWHHQHHFREVPGGVEVEDLVHYILPSPGGRLVARWLVSPRLREIFEYRRRVLAERFGESR